MGEVVLGCSGWNYPDIADKGGWTGVFYPDKDTKRLRISGIGILLGFRNGLGILPPCSPCDVMVFVCVNIY
jgi:hypothetical protein